jgi:hypothetical protein
LTSLEKQIHSFRLPDSSTQRVVASPSPRPRVVSHQQQRISPVTIDKLRVPPQSLMIFRMNGRSRRLPGRRKWRNKRLHIRLTMPGQGSTCCAKTSV